MVSIIAIAIFLVLHLTKIVEISSLDATIEECRTRPDNNNCDGSSSVIKFYFDIRTKVCQPIAINQCNKESAGTNIFETRDQCMKKCGQLLINQKNNVGGDVKIDAQLRSCPGRLRPYAIVTVPTINTLSVAQVVECQQNVTVCPIDSHKCDQSLGLCCPTKEFVCNARYDSGKFGVGGKMTPRYFFNRELHACNLFTYFGYAGNDNNFETFDDCNNFCNQ